jgi:hypothetical protein
MLLTHSLKPPGDPTLEPMKWKNWFQAFAFGKRNLFRYTTARAENGAVPILQRVAHGGALQVESS